MGNQQSVTAEDVAAMEAKSRHLNETKDPSVKSMKKRLKAMMEQVASGAPPDFKKIFDELAVDGKIDKANFAILLRGAFNLAVKTAIVQGQNTGVTDAVAEVSQASVTGIAIAVKAANRLDLHSTKLMDRVFAFLDKDNSGALDFEEIQTFIETIMTNPQAVADPFSFLGGAGSDKITVTQVVDLCDEVFEFFADLMIQVVDVMEDVLTSADVLHAMELDAPVWQNLFGPLGENGALSKEAVQNFAAQEFWDQANAQFTAGINLPPVKAAMEIYKTQMLKFRDTVCEGISETGNGQEGLARAYAWLKNGVDETTFMSTMLPSVRKAVQEHSKPEKIAEQIRSGLTAGVAAQTDPQAQAISNMVATQLGQPGFLEAILNKPACLELMEKYSKACEEKMPIMLHHCFRFCDINSDGGVSEAELKVLFALKDCIARGKLNEALVHIFEVVDEDGNGTLTPKEILNFFSKLIHFMCAMQRTTLSLYFEVLLPGIIKIALPEVCQAVGITEVTKENLPQLMMMGMMQMGQFQDMAAGKGQGKGY